MKKSPRRLPPFPFLAHAEDVADAGRRPSPGDIEFLTRPSTREEPDATTEETDD